MLTPSSVVAASAFPLPQFGYPHRHVYGWSDDILPDGSTGTTSVAHDVTVSMPSEFSLSMGALSSAISQATEESLGASIFATSTEPEAVTTSVRFTFKESKIKDLKIPFHRRAL